MRSICVTFPSSQPQSQLETEKNEKIGPINYYQQFIKSNNEEAIKTILSLLSQSVIIP